MVKPTKEEQHATLEIIFGKLKDAIENDRAILLTYLIREDDFTCGGDVFCSGGTRKMSDFMRDMLKDSFLNRP